MSTTVVAVCVHIIYNLYPQPRKHAKLSYRYIKYLAAGSAAHYIVFVVVVLILIKLSKKNIYYIKCNM